MIDIMYSVVSWYLNLLLCKVPKVRPRMVMPIVGPQIEPPPVVGPHMVKLYDWARMVDIKVVRAPRMVPRMVDARPVCWGLII